MEAKATHTRFWKLSGGVAGLIVLLAILIAVNVIVGGLRLRKDLTAEKLYTLSDGTRQVLSKLDRKVTLMFFFSDSAPDVPAPIKAFARQVEDLLHEYELAGKGNVKIVKLDPKPDSNDEDLAQRYGLQGQAISQSGTMLYLGLVARCGETEAAIPVIDPRNDELLEYTFTRLVHRVATVKKPVLGVLSTLPVLGRAPMPFMMPGQRPRQEPAWVPFRELTQDYDVRSLEPGSVDKIDAGIDTLLVVHPKGLSDKALYAIDQFVLRGGRLVAFVDPFCVADPGQGAEMGGYSMPQRSSTLGKLFDAWGVKYQPDKIVADLDASTPLRGRNNTVESSPLYLSLRRPNFAEREVITSPLESAMMVLAGAFGSEAAEGLKLTPLIRTSEKSDLMDAMMAQFDPSSFRRTFKSGHKALNLAVRLQGTFKSAFPEGKPAESAGTNAVPPAADADHLAASKTPGTVILVGDVDMLYDDFCVQKLNFLGAEMLQPINDNMSLFVNMVEQMSGSADLIAVRCRGSASRPFTRVLALQAQAEERWLSEEQALQQKLESTQRRLAELQNQKDDKQRFVLSPEQTRAIEGFRQDALECKKQLKNVRRNLREGIESLGMKVKMINILLMPALVALAGIGFWLIRRGRTRAQAVRNGRAVGA